MFRTAALLSLLALSGCASQAGLPNWAPIDSSRFPLEITSIAFPSGFAIGPTTGVTLPNGSWMIRYPSSGQVIAESSLNREITISPLSCVSGSVGEQPCYIRLQHERGQVPVCEVLIGTLPDQNSGSFIVSITCPDLWTRSS